MDSIELALQDLRLQDYPNISLTLIFFYFKNILINSTFLFSIFYSTVRVTRVFCLSQKQRGSRIKGYNTGYHVTSTLH